MKNKRVLFVSEAVTLAHVARPLVLANYLHSEGYDVVFAVDPRADWALKGTQFPRRPLRSISTEQFFRAIDEKKHIYPIEVLRGYLKDDLELLDDVKPGLVVGDFRLSLAVSAPLRNIPFAAITNVHWGPLSLNSLEFPNPPGSSVFGLAASDIFFNALIAPIVGRYLASPLNGLRKENGFPPVGNNLREVYTYADYRLYADVPNFCPTKMLPENQFYIGPILWSPPTPFPAWWNDVPSDLPILYVSMGSSGDTGMLPKLFAALGGMNVSVLLSTAGRASVSNAPKNFFVADYLSGEECSKRASLVVTNGGSMSGQQALSVGVPVLGIPANPDQCLFMKGVKDQGAGDYLRGNVTAARVRQAVEKILRTPSYRESALRIASIFKPYDAKQTFLNVVDELLDRTR